jgi:uncharacterized protein (DUF433 family)
MSLLRDIVHSDPNILGGIPVFVGTRLPIQSLFDYLEGGETLDEFLRQFPSVKRGQAVAALELARTTLSRVRALLDEQLPVDLAAAVQGHSVDTVVGRGGRNGSTNGNFGSDRTY